MTDPDDATQLRADLSSEDWEIRKLAAARFASQPFSQVSDLLRATINDANSPNNVDNAVREAAVRSIFTTADPYALEALMLENSAAADRDDFQMGSLITDELRVAVHGTHPDHAARLLDRLRTLKRNGGTAGESATDLLDWLGVDDA